MLKFFKDFFTVNIGLKLIALVLAVALWFYVVSEVDKGREDDRQFLNKVLPAGGMVAKKLPIKAVIVGAPARGKG